jgi:signal transduction histidine kinase/ligand-binding sensor domain-containing protein
LWIGTAGSGFYHFDPATAQFSQHVVNPQDVNGYTFNDVLALHDQDENTLWVGTDGGGLYRFHKDTGELIPCLTDPHDATSLSSPYVRAIYQDRAGVLWIGSSGGGINKLDSAQEKFLHFQHDPQELNSLSQNRVQALQVDGQGQLWIGTDGGGVDRLDLSTGTYAHYRHDPADANSLTSDYVTAILEDPTGALWIGTLGGGINRLDPVTGQFTHYRFDPLNNNSLNSDVAAPMLVDRDNNLWIAVSERGLDRIALPQVSAAPEDVEFIHYRAASRTQHRLSSAYVLQMVQDPSGMIWIATATGGLNRFDPATETFRNYRADADNPKSLSDDSVRSILLDPPDGLWLGTAAGLDHFDIASETCTHHAIADSLPGNRINAMLRDDEGVLWLSSERGVTRFDPATGAVRSYGTDDGLQGYEFTHAAAQGADGALYFGGTNGFNLFYPQQLRDNPYVPPIVLTALRQGGEDIPTETALENLDEITLHWPNNEFEFEFAALNYSQPSQNRYAYMLEGFDSRWNYIGDRRFGKYTNLPGGNYLLHLKGSNNDRVWNEEGTTVQVTVVPPIWQTPWFQALALLALALGVVGGYRLRVRGIEARSQELEHQVAVRTEEINRRRQELEALYLADQELYSHLQLDDVLQALTNIAVDVMKADKSAVLGWDEPQEHLVMWVTHGFHPQSKEALTFRRGEGVMGLAVAGEEPVVVEDALNDPRCLQEKPETVRAVAAEGIRSFMNLPISLNGEVFGVFNVSYTKPHLFATDERRMLIALAQRAAQAIENARLFDAQQRKAEQFRVISEVGRHITSVMAVDELLQQMAQLIQETFAYYHVGFGLIEGNQVVYRVGAGSLWEEAQFEFQPARLGIGQDGISGRVAATGQPHLARDVRQDPYYLWMGGSRTLSEVVVPIRVQDQVIGVLDVQSDRLDAFDSSDLTVLQALAHQAGAAIENARLYQQAQEVAVIRERSRLARDLHDAVTQTLFSASLLAEVLPTTWESDPEEGQQLLQELRQLSRGALAEMRALLLELRPAALAEADLGDLLRQLAEAVTGRTGVPVTVTVDEDCDLREEVHVALYRIAQEVLNNVVKHARASQANVSLRCQEVADQAGLVQVELDIEDDGVGFVIHDVAPDRLGLAIMRERAQAIEADLHIDSAVDKGTRVRVVWRGPQQE